MKLVDAQVEILDQGSTLVDMYKHITKCGYTCYKTEKEITEESAKAFVERMIASKHTAMLEHGTVLMAVPLKVYNVSPMVKKEVARLLSFSLWTRWFRAVINKTPQIIIVTNYRVIVEHGFQQIMERFWWDNPQGKSARVTVKFITDRGVSHELVRHRVFSFAQESTRYCNYSLDKFGNELTFVKPSWYDKADEKAKSAFEATLDNASTTYLNLLGLQYTPQQARNVLPNALKTEVIMTGFIDDWMHFFDLRALDKTGPAHPDMHLVADPLFKEFTERKLIKATTDSEKISS